MMFALVKQFTIRVDSVTYSIRQKANIYSVLDNGIEILQLKVTLGKNVNFFWETCDGSTSHLINKIGLAIELHDIESYV
jgi:hypothetical protein